MGNIDSNLAKPGKFDKMERVRQNGESPFLPQQTTALVFSNLIRQNGKLRQNGKGEPPHGENFDKMENPPFALNKNCRVVKHGSKMDLIFYFELSVKDLSFSNLIITS